MQIRDTRCDLHMRFTGLCRVNGSEKGGISAPMGGLSRGLLVFLSSVGLLQPLVPCTVSDFRKMKAAKTKTNIRKVKEKGD